MSISYKNCRRPYALEVAPALPANIASMMLQQERDILYSIAKNYYEGIGDIVDAGIFLGASTYCFVRGIENNSIVSGRARIIAYERAIMNRFMADNKGIPSDIRKTLGQPGSDYSCYLNDIIASIGGPVDLHCGDITKKDYNGAVEVLFLDILKTKNIFKHCNNMFMNKLIPGKSIIIQQDYFWHLDWWINAYMELLSEYFCVIDSAETSCVFLNTEKIPDMFSYGDPLVNIRRRDIIALLEKSKDKSSTIFQYIMMELCIINYCVNSGLLGNASERLKRFERIFCPIVSECKPTQLSMNRVKAAWMSQKRKLKIEIDKK